MKLTITLIAVLSVTAVFAKKEKKIGEVKESKRDAELGYPSIGQSHSFHAPSLGHGDASAISIGAGYSVGGGKPSYSFGSQDAGAYQYSQDNIQGGGHPTYQLAPITLQPAQGSYSGSDLSQLMSQITHGINSGAISLAPNVGELHLTNVPEGHGQQQPQLAYPQFSYGAQKLQLQPQYSVHEGQASPPSYAAGHKGLGSYSTGPVLFNPAESAPSHQQAFNLNSIHGGHSFGDSGLSLGGGHFNGLSLGGASHGNSFGNLKTLGGGYQVASGKPSFKPSAYLGSSASHGEHEISYASPSFGGHQLSGGHGSLSLSSGGSPSFGGHQLSGNHGGLTLSSGGHGGGFGGSFNSLGGGPSKYTSHSYLPSKHSFSGASLDSVAYASHDHSPPRTTYGIPSGSTPSHSGASTPQYYLSSSKHLSPSFGHSGASFRAPSSGHSSLSHSSPKYTFVGHSVPSSRYASSKDIQGAYSEPVYNTIKYSEALQSHAH